jgi:hypothetical protein
MDFKIQDLMIRIIPEAAGQCEYPTCKYTCNCDTACTQSAFLMNRPHRGADPHQHLAALKEELRRAINNVGSVQHSS